MPKRTNLRQEIIVYPAAGAGGVARRSRGIRDASRRSDRGPVFVRRRCMFAAARPMDSGTRRPPAREGHVSRWRWGFAVAWLGFERREPSPYASGQAFGVAFALEDGGVGDNANREIGVVPVPRFARRAKLRSWVREDRRRGFGRSANREIGVPGVGVVGLVLGGGGASFGARA